MAARRLVIVMLVLLAVSVAAAALAPQRERNDAGETATTATGATGPTGETQTTGTTGDAGTNDEFGPAGIERVTVQAGDGDPKSIYVKPGTQLVLSVEGDFGDNVEIPALGLVETMTSAAPAVFNILATQNGVYGVVTDRTAKLVAKIVVTPDDPPQPGQAGKQGQEDKQNPKGSGAGGGAHDVKGSGASGPDEK